jgi:GNAT superfamily N-acetyltransferase
MTKMSEPMAPISQEPVGSAESARTRETSPAAQLQSRSETPHGAHDRVRQFSVRQSVSAADRAGQLDLRYRVLREPLGMSREQAVFARDDDADTIHLLAVAFNSADDVVDAQRAADEVADAQGETLGDGHDGPASTVSFNGTVFGTVIGTVIGTATMITHGPNDVQLRGMATDSAWDGCGVGKAVLEVAHQLAGSRSLWCDARMSAHDFYARLGWVAEGEIFDIPQVGPHTVMRYRGLPNPNS